jgi:hypothetical protein
MAIKRPRKEDKKPPPAAANAGGSSLATAERPPHGPGAGADRIQPPPPPLPPGVYFSPTKEECLQFLNRSIGGDGALADARGYIFHANVYGESPEALRRRHPPASTREGDHAWWFLSQTRFQSSRTSSRSKRADRRVGAAGHWGLEQTRTALADDAGFKNCFGFYTGKRKAMDKTQWLRQGGVPAVYKIYVTPHATHEQLMDTYGLRRGRHKEVA